MPANSVSPEFTATRRVRPTKNPVPRIRPGINATVIVLLNSMSPTAPPKMIILERVDALDPR